MNRHLLVLLATSAMLSGCAINQQTAHKYASAAHESALQGNWIAAREQWKRALINAKVGNMNDRALAVANYEYGRASGVVCAWDEAEAGLKESLRLDVKNGGPVYKSNYELGRMHYDRKQYQTAVEYFAKVKIQFDAIQAETKDPVGYAEFLDEYATSLEQLNKSEDAKPLRARSSELRKMFPSHKAHTDKTPYGTQCHS